MSLAFAFRQTYTCRRYGNEEEKRSPSSQEASSQGTDAEDKQTRRQKPPVTIAKRVKVGVKVKVR